MEENKKELEEAPLVQAVKDGDGEILNYGFFSSLWNFGWTPTSQNLLESAERRVLKGIKSNYKQFFVDAGPHKINTLTMGNGPPLVLVHGFGGGIGIWLANYETLAQHYTIYAFDMLGFGRSSRAAFIGLTAETAEDYFLDAMEDWRKSIGLEKFFLMGHSLGGFLSAAYALKKPEHVSTLILADPWGFPKKPAEDPQQTIPLRWRLIRGVLSTLPTPLSLLRAAGPMGPGLVNRVRPDISHKFLEHVQDPEAVSNYIYHCNAQVPTGEMAFTAMSIPFGWAKLPLAERINNLHPSIPLKVIFGEKTWMDYGAFVKSLPNVKGEAELVLLPKAGHHVYIDNAQIFNEAVIFAGKSSLSKLNSPNVHYFDKNNVPNDV